MLNSPSKPSEPSIEFCSLAFPLSQHTISGKMKKLATKAIGGETASVFFASIPVVQQGKQIEIKHLPGLAQAQTPNRQILASSASSYSLPSAVSALI